MKKYITLLVIILITFSGCSDESECVIPPKVIEYKIDFKYTFRTDEGEVYNYKNLPKIDLLNYRVVSKALNIDKKINLTDTLNVSVSIPQGQDFLDIDLKVVDKYKNKIYDYKAIIFEVDTIINSYLKKEITINLKSRIGGTYWEDHTDNLNVTNFRVNNKPYPLKSWILKDSKYEPKMIVTFDNSKESEYVHITKGLTLENWRIITIKNTSYEKYEKTKNIYTVSNNYK